MTSLQNAVASLPEVYQPIYDHEELCSSPSRICDDRLQSIKTVHDAVHHKLGRAVRILDLGCAQGYISLTMASWGAEVVGVEVYSKNVDVCELLAAEHPDYHVAFVTARIEDFLLHVKPNDFDIVLGLSVFHHMCKTYGWEKVRDQLSVLAGKIKLGIFELALAEEPVFWAKALPHDYKMLLSGFRCLKLLRYHETHLSGHKRPLCFASNKYVFFKDMGLLEIDDMRMQSHAGSVASSGKKYFFSGNKFIKYADTRMGVEASYKTVCCDFQKEVAFLSDMGGKFGFPKVYAIEQNADETWIVREKIHGKLLSDIIQNGEPFDSWDVIKQTLRWLIILEQHGYYCDDVRTWNIIYDYGTVHLIDYASMGRTRRDCVWPWDLLLSFFIFINEVLERKYHTGFIRSTHMLTTLKKYISREQYLELLNLPQKENIFPELHEILFSKQNGEKKSAYTLKDKELEAIGTLVETVMNDWMDGKWKIHDELRELKEYKENASELLNKMTEILIEQQEKIEALEKQVFFGAK